MLLEGDNGSFHQWSVTHSSTSRSKVCSGLPAARRAQLTHLAITEKNLLLPRNFLSVAVFDGIEVRLLALSAKKYRN